MVDGRPPLPQGWFGLGKAAGYLGRFTRLVAVSAMKLERFRAV